MDTTYFGHKLGVMVFKDATSKTFLFKQIVKHETTSLYVAGIAEIRRRGIVVQSIICDGRKGLFSVFGETPVQMCQFHQVQIMQRYLTKKPKTECGIELRDISLLIKSSTQKELENRLEKWYEKWQKYINTRTVHTETKKTFFTHKRLRSAYFSLKRNLPFLFVFEQYPLLKIPKTTNGLDGSFANLKNKLRNHNGLNQQNKIRFIEEFFKV